MDYTQNKKIMQITETTLIIGVDIAKKDHYARAFDWRGIELDKTISFRANGTGFNEFMDWIDRVKLKHYKNKTVIGIEPTGHYWFTFGREVLGKEYTLVQVNPFHVKRSKELDDNTPSKSDRKDPKTIAMLIKDGRYQIPYMPVGNYAELRNMNNLREEMIKKIWSVKNKMIRWLDINFPEFLNVFSTWEGKTALVTLDKLVLPSEIKKYTKEEILKIWRENDIRRGVGIKRAEKLLDESMRSVGVTEGKNTAKFEMSLLLREYKELRDILEDIESKLSEMTLIIPGAKNILEIKGIGIRTVAGFFAEIGEIKRFRHPKQIIKLAGLNVGENSSGKHKGQTKITKRGRKRLRALIFRAVLPLIATNEDFRELHKIYTTRKVNPLKKLQSIMVIGCKLIKVIYTLVVKDTAYDSSKMFKDIKRLEVA